jgi:hypothetical protein
MNLEKLLRETSPRAVPAALDHQVRTALRTLPFPGSHFAFPVLALGLALAATLALTVGLALSLASAGAGEQGVSIAVAVVVGYFGLASVVSLPLLARLKTSRPRQGAEA